MKTEEVLERVPMELVLKIESALDEISCDENVGKADFVEALVLVTVSNIGCLFAIKGDGFDTPERRVEAVKMFSDLLDEAIEGQKRVALIAGIDTYPCECCCETETHPIQ